MNARDTRIQGLAEKVTEHWQLALLAAFAAAGLISLLVPFLFYRAPADQELTAQGIQGAEQLKAKNDRWKLQNELRSSLLQAVGGAAVVFGLIFTARQIQNTREQLRTSQQQLENDRERQVTERYTRAIDQLGSEMPDVRLGGIYALERIARNSTNYQSTIDEVLAAFVREHSPWSPPRARGLFSSLRSRLRAGTSRRAEMAKPQVKADVQASATVLGRCQLCPDGRRLVLRKVDLCGYELMDALLDGVDLRGSHLDEANLNRAHLQKAILWDANIKKADLRDANLEGANLMDANLKEAILWGAHLERANLFQGHLEGAHLMHAHLEGANLNHAHLEKADLRDAHLDGASLWKTHLGGVCLEEAHLEGANLTDAHLDGANLDHAHLEKADLRDAHLEGASLWRTHLDRAYLKDAHLERANLRDAHLQGANLDHAHLEKADLENAHLEGANLRDANIEKAILQKVHYSSKTIWPEGFDWNAATGTVPDEPVEQHSDSPVSPS
jgi:uncharacterized protein YjbI with pentapeptide repeats